MCGILAPVMDETPDPRGETRAFCEALVTDVALARGAGDVQARVVALRTAALNYPAYPDAEDTPVEGWLRELDELARQIGSRELAALVLGRRTILAVRASRLTGAGRLVDALAPGLPEAARRLADVGRAEFAVADGKTVDEARLREIAAGDDVDAAIAAKSVLAVVRSWDGKQAGVAAWRELLAEIPGPMLDARLCALEHLLIHDVEQRGSLLRRVVEMHLGSGRGLPVLTLAERYPGQIDPSRVEEAHALQQARVPASAKARPARAQGAAGQPGKEFDIFGAFAAVVGPTPDTPPKKIRSAGWGWAGIAALIFGGLGIVVIWLRYS